MRQCGVFQVGVDLLVDRVLSVMVLDLDQIDRGVGDERVVAARMSVPEVGRLRDLRANRAFVCVRRKVRQVWFVLRIGAGGSRWLRRVLRIVAAATRCPKRRSSP